METGSVLDAEYMNSFPRVDIVYSWGVLHHSGQVWVALEHAGCLVKDGGKLFIAIYNDQGTASALWRWVKHSYNRSSKLVRPPILWPAFVQTYWRWLLKELVLLRVSGISCVRGAARHVAMARPGGLGGRLSFRSWQNRRRSSIFTGRGAFVSRS